MLGVVGADAPLSELLDFFARSPFDNAFIVDKRRQIVHSANQTTWRSLLARGIDTALPLDAALAMMKRWPDVAVPQSHISQRLGYLGCNLSLDGTLLGTYVKASNHGSGGPSAQGLIMAGGLGRRLGELTRDTPKPMLTIAEKPMAEHLVDNFVDNNITDLFFSLCYLPEKIRGYFGDGRRWGANIGYVLEDRPLGTAGCLSLVARQVDRPLVMINGDVVTNVQVSRLLDFHLSQSADITVSTKVYHSTIPFGVVRHKDGVVEAISEKPKIPFEINLAMYVLSPHVLEEVPRDERIDMPDLIRLLLPRGFRVVTCPIYEQWVDVGHLAELAKTRDTYDPHSRPNLTMMATGALSPASVAML